MNKQQIQLLNDIPIASVAERLGISIMKNKMAICFLHDEKTPSLSLYKRNNTWKCFGCDQGGDVIKLVEKYCKMSFIDACSWLANEFKIFTTNVPFDRSQIELAKRNYQKKLEKKKDSINLPPDPEVYSWFIENCTLSKSGRDYLSNNRGFSEKTIASFGLKDITNPNEIFQKAKEKFGIQRLLNCGIAKEINGSVSLLWWGHTLIIPFINEKGEVIYLQGRNLDPNTNYKYVNLKGVSPDIFNGNILFGLSPGNYILVCEGAMDAMMAVQHGKSAIGIAGASGFKAHWAKRLEPFEINIVPDNDKGGETFWIKVSKAFYDIGKNARRVIVPAQFKDLSDYLKQKTNS